MRRFRITIEGESYEVEVEEIEEAKPMAPASTAKAPPAAPVSSAPPKVAPVSEAAPKEAMARIIKPPPRVMGEEVIISPMPGTIISIKVKVGDTVKAGDVLLVLESMKMQNEVPAPRDGKIREIYVAEGSYVRRREPLMAMEI